MFELNLQPFITATLGQRPRLHTRSWCPSLWCLLSFRCNTDIHSGISSSKPSTSSNVILLYPGMPNPGPSLRNSRLNSACNEHVKVFDSRHTNAKTTHTSNYFGLTSCQQKLTTKIEKLRIIVVISLIKVQQSCYSSHNVK